MGFVHNLLGRLTSERYPIYSSVFSSWVTTLLEEMSQPDAIEAHRISLSLIQLSYMNHIVHYMTQMSLGF